MNDRGFSMVEMIVSVVILSVAILALTSTTARLTGIAVNAERRALALQAVEDRIAQIRLHAVYQQLDSIYSESGTTLEGLTGLTRNTEIVRVIREGVPLGKFIDFTRITVTVEGLGLAVPVSRTISIGAF